MAVPPARVDGCRGQWRRRWLAPMAAAVNGADISAICLRYGQLYDTRRKNAI
jgi:hypothetical protein